MRTKFAALIVIGFLTSCASYSPKEGEPTSLLRVVTFDGSALFEAVDTASCPQYLPIIYKPLSKDDMRPEKALGIRGQADPSASNWYETHIPADKKLILNLQSVRATDRPGYQAQCSIGVLLEPKQGAEYELHYRHGVGSCRVSIFELGANGQRKNLLANSANAPTKVSQSWVAQCQAGRWN
jgi:hypothetical protein